MSQRVTEANRLPATAKVLSGLIVVVDGKFDESVAVPTHEVVTIPFGE